MPRLAEKRNAPPALQRLIDFVNSVSAQLEPPVRPFERVEAFARQLKREKRFREFRKVTGLKNPLDLWCRYMELLHTREFLRRIAEIEPGTRELSPDYVTHRIRVGGDGKLYFACMWPELEGVEVARIRKCPARVRRSTAELRSEKPFDPGRAKWLKWHCGRIFWVKTLGKRTMTGCCPTHTATIKMARLRQEGYKW